MIRSAADIRRGNVLAVARALHLRPGISRRGVAEVTGLSPATVSTVCTQLHGRGLLNEIGMTRPLTGRPSSQLALHGGRGVLLGVDVAETYVNATTFDAALAEISSTQAPVRTHRPSSRALVRRVGDAIAAERARHRHQPVLGVGVSVPGQVDPQTGTSVFAANLGWHDVALLPMLGEVVRAPLLLDNPLKALATAELWRNPSRGQQTFAVLNLGTGVGAGIAVDGVLLRGRTNSAGEWGHTVLVADGRPCVCGGRGCVEAYVGAPGIVRTLREFAPRDPLLGAGSPGEVVAALAEGVRRDELSALAVLDVLGRQLGLAAASLVNLLNPDALLLQGAVADAFGEQLARRCREHLSTQALRTAVEAVSVELAPPGTNPVATGMAALALEQFLRDPSFSEEFCTAGVTTRAED